MEHRPFEKTTEDTMEYVAEGLLYRGGMVTIPLEEYRELIARSERLKIVGELLAYDGSKASYQFDRQQYEVLVRAPMVEEQGADDNA